MIKKRYTITFDPKLASIDEPLRQLEAMGVQVESAQRFIGTAVVEANPAQAAKARAMRSIAAVAETGKFRIAAETGAFKVN